MTSGPWSGSTRCWAATARHSRHRTRSCTASATVVSLSCGWFALRRPRPPHSGTDRLAGVADRLAEGRDAFDREAWGRAYEHLGNAQEAEPLEVEDLERLAAAAYLTGRRRESGDVWVRAHQECARLGEIARAALCAFWLAFELLN